MRRLLVLSVTVWMTGCNCGSSMYLTGGRDGGRLPDGGLIGAGGGSGGGGAGGAGQGGGDPGSLPDGGCVPAIVATLRDFREAHPDFEDFLGSKRGIVQALLGPGSKPVYGPEPRTMPIVTSGAANFDQWYRDVPNINMTFRETPSAPPK